MVSFFMFFYSEYNVMMVDENYQISLVGSKAEKYLWILSRTPEPDPDLLKMILVVTIHPSLSGWTRAVI